MDTPTWINFLILLATILAAAIAWRATFAARDAARESNDIQKRLLIIEEQRERDRIASLRPVKFEISCKNYDSGLSEVTALNTGEQTAFNVQFFLLRLPFEGLIEEIPPGESVTINNLRQGIYLPVDLHIKWQDQNGNGKSQTITISKCKN